MLPSDTCLCVCVRACVCFPVRRGTLSVLDTELCVHWGVEVLRPKVADHSG